MQAPNIDTFHILQSVAEQGKFWVGLATAIIAGYKGFEWVKQIRTKDLKEIHDGIKSMSGKIDTQTASVVGELKEMRADFRTFYISPAPAMLTARAKPVAKKRTPKIKPALLGLDNGPDAC